MTTTQRYITSFVFVGSFTSNGYPSLYSNGQLQRWLMCGTPKDLLCIHFTDFDTENVHDKVTVANQSGVVIVQSYSGAQVPPDIQSQTNLYVNFSSDDSVTQKGFRATFCMLHH